MNDARPPILGAVQWFPFEDRKSVDETVAICTDLGITELRVLLSWADWMREGGKEWFDWYMERMASIPNIRLLPSLFYTPMQVSMKDGDGETKTSYPPEDPKTYVHFVREMINRYGERFDWIQIWNEPNWNPYWDWTMDPLGERFAAMAIPAARTAHELGKKTVLGGTTPLDYAWFGRMHELGTLSHMDAVSFHYSPSWKNQHRRWLPLPTEIASLRALLRGFGLACEVWLDEVGFSTNTATDHDEKRLEKQQVEYFDEIRAMPAERVYWFCLLDQSQDVQTDDAINTDAEPDPTAYHFGLLTNDGKKKPLYAHWKGLRDAP